VTPTGDVPQSDATEKTKAVIALAANGRELGRTQATEAEAIDFDLPLALRNDVVRARIEGVNSAGAVQLSDGRDRRALVGIIDTGAVRSDTLLSGAYYIRNALDPFAEFLEGDLGDLVQSDASVIVLDDLGSLRAEDAEAIEGWIGKGGVLIRFAGPDLAEAASDAAPKLLPVALRGGGRAFGGALSWEEPQLLSTFATTGPFADLVPPTDVFVRRQVLATPGAETTARAWASLEDGTPLVTGEARGQGALVLFHVTATPDWSDLPISGVFVEMLRRVIFLSALGPQSVEEDGDTRLAPISVLDGFGALQPPPPTLQGVTIAEANAGPTQRHPPGLYGAREAPIAMNAVSSGETLAPFGISGLDTEAYVTAPPERVAPWLFVVAIALLLIDALASLALAGRLRVAALLLMLGGAVALAPEQSVAQALQLPVAAKTEQAALATSFAYVRTGDQSVDRLSRLGLATLSRQLTARTAVEPGEPVAIDPAVDDLSVYPLVYWPLIAGAETPSGEALSNIETFMRFGGLVIFDTRDDERAIAGLETPERRALQNILRNIDTPPLLPLPDDHVLTRSFYLLEDLPGRMANNPVWVQAAGDRNDGVTPLIIGGRDWAGAWAADDVGRSVLPMARGGVFRLAALTGLVGLLLNPQVREADLTALPDIVVLLVDRSASQTLDNRDAITTAAEEKIAADLSALGDVEIRTLAIAGADRTAIGEAFEQAVGETARARLAGVVVITDGQSADEIDVSGLPPEAPVHVMLTGAADEQDRRISLIKAPRYGIVDEAVDVSFRIDDLGIGEIALDGAPSAIVSLRVNGEEALRQPVPIGEEVSFSAPLESPGKTVIELEAAPLNGELTVRNNIAVLPISVIRDRLRVLLISGEPHPGERVWRNLLKSDPAIDLVHFTILRPTEKAQSDGALERELALIEFPQDELFIEKLNEFDLVIFDRYTYRGVLNA
jgi:hypothetical protein